MPSLTDDEHGAVMSELVDWVEEFAQRFAVEPRVIPPCWALHNEMVETLAALRDHERGSYAVDAPPTGAVDFLRAWRDIEHTLTTMTATTQCTALEHRPRRTPGYPAREATADR
ncbi:MAG TPA: hypothetical protein P5181_07205 [Dermatophilaceae bacterium]|nr:hypothetical protein [Dermatophilaceae bacterium]